MKSSKKEQDINNGSKRNIKSKKSFLDPTINFYLKKEHAITDQKEIEQKKKKKLTVSGNFQGGNVNFNIINNKSVKNKQKILEIFSPLESPKDVAIFSQSKQQQSSISSKMVSPKLQKKDYFLTTNSNLKTQQSFYQNTIKTEEDKQFENLYKNQNEQQNQKMKQKLFERNVNSSCQFKRQAFNLQHRKTLTNILGQDFSSKNQNNQFYAINNNNKKNNYYGIKSQNGSFLGMNKLQNNFCGFNQQKENNGGNLNNKSQISTKLNSAKSSCNNNKIKNKFISIQENLSRFSGKNKDGVKSQLFLSPTSNNSYNNKVSGYLFQTVKNKSKNSFDDDSCYDSQRTSFFFGHKQQQQKQKEEQIQKQKQELEEKEEDLEDDDMSERNQNGKKLKKYSTLKKKAPKKDTKRWAFGKDAVQFSQQESKKLITEKTINQAKQQEIAQDLYIQLLETLKENVMGLLPYGEPLRLNIFKKQELDQKFKQLCADSQKSRNPVLSILSSMTYAKVCHIQKDYLQAIRSYRECKNQCKVENLLKYKMKCYKNLGLCYQHIKKYKQAIHFFTKFLKLAYYLENIDKEIQGYDYIGLQYYYLGDLEKAKYYHVKMLKGDYHDSENELVKVIKSQIKRSLTKEGISEKEWSKGRKFNSNLKNHPNELDISSSEDEGLPIKENIQQYISENQGINNTINSSNNAQIGKHSRDFFKSRVEYNKTNPYLHENRNQEANQNIRLQDKFGEGRNLVQKSKVNFQSKYINQNVIILNHLSVNRDLDNYSQCDLRLNQKGFPIDFYDQSDLVMKRKIIKYLNRFMNNLYSCITMIDRTIYLHNQQKQAKEMSNYQQQSEQERNQSFKRPQKRLGILFNTINRASLDLKGKKQNFFGYKGNENHK